jgi:hypothetical protein
MLHLHDLRGRPPGALWVRALGLPEPLHRISPVIYRSYAVASFAFGRAVPFLLFVFRCCAGQRKNRVPSGRQENRKYLSDHRRLKAGTHVPPRKSCHLGFQNSTEVKNAQTQCPAYMPRQIPTQLRSPPARWPCCMGMTRSDAISPAWPHKAARASETARHQAEPPFPVDSRPRPAPRVDRRWSLGRSLAGLRSTLPS